ncbi:MAG: preprotein translocase subunit YajC [Firmicutes bacterium]|nr:preprotein translocase subunit YajC [Bacillota bacterium]MDY3659193.1 preprotein translocase subunit YajC [Eubacteriales bacterium]
MLFLAEVANATQWILPAVLLVLVIGIFILNYFRSKKNQESMKNMVDGLKVGDNVKTYSGLYGKILEIVETTDGKVAVLETGSEKNKGIFSIDINAIYGIDEKKPVVYDADGNIIDEEAKTEEPSKDEKSETDKPKRKSKKQPVEEAKPEEKIEESKTEQPTVEEKVEVQPALETSEEKEELPKTTKKTTKKSK